MLKMSEICKYSNIQDIVTDECGNWFQTNVINLSKNSWKDGIIVETQGSPYADQSYTNRTYLADHYKSYWPW